MRFKLFFLLTFISLSGFAQQDTVFIRHAKDCTIDTLVYVTDTIIFDSGMMRQVLTGTTILPSTHNQQIAKGFAGLYFTEVTKSDCKKNMTAYGSEPDRINSIVSTDSTLTVDINIVDNCCYSFLCDISVDTSATLNLIYYGYGNYCACDCCFGLTFHFTKMKDPDYAEIKAVMLNDNRKTIKNVVSK